MANARHLRMRRYPNSHHARVRRGHLLLEAARKMTGSSPVMMIPISLVMPVPGPDPGINAVMRF
jgi:hypothetical protein